MSTHHTLKICLAASEIRQRRFQGRDHLILPTIMLTEGVHHGSAGPLFYPAEEIRRSAPHWNGKPCTLQHPARRGSPTSASSDPGTWEAHTLGQLWNARYQDGKLRADIYLDKARTEELAPELLEALRAGQNIEVSTGIYTEDERSPGAWRGEAYEAIARNYHPDHLALLPGGKGACSWEDGCGIRINCKQKEKPTMTTPLHTPRPWTEAAPEAIELIRNEMGDHRLKLMTAQDIEEQARELKTCGGRCASQEGCTPLLATPTMNDYFPGGRK